MESCQQELKASAVELQQCRVENEQLRAAKGAPDGLRGLIVTNEIDEKTGILTDLITDELTQRAGNAFKAWRVSSHRSPRSVKVTFP